MIVMSGLVSFSHSGNFTNTEGFLKHLRNLHIENILNKYGAKGVTLLQEATPKKSGKTAESWSYEVTINGEGAKIEWLNTNMGNDGKTPVAILIQMGHGTRTGGYVPPNDFINPVMEPLFEEIVAEIDRAVKYI